MWDPVWEKVFSSRAWGKYPAELLIRFVARNFYGAHSRKDVKILEVGCGPGGNLWFLCREGFSFAGIDGSPTAIDQAKARLSQECPGWEDRGQFVVGDMSSLPFGDNTFDAVIDNEAACCNSFENTVKIFTECARVTKPGGRIFSRTFSTETWGYGIGEKIGHNMYVSQEGFFAGLGQARFTAEDEIPKLLPHHRIDTVEKLSWTVGNQEHQIVEWIIEGTKK